MKPRPVHCVIYSHVWGLFHLGQLAGIGPLERVAVVELAINSNLGAAFADPMRPRAGIGGLLRHRMSLDDVLEPAEGLPFGMAFAPRPPIPIGALASAVSLLSTAPGSADEVVLMVHAMEALQLHAAMVSADRFCVLWDLADRPTRALAQVGEALTAQRVLAPDQWGGFHLYTDPRRPVSNAEQVRAEFMAILGQYPEIAAAQPA